MEINLREARLEVGNQRVGYWDIGFESVDGTLGRYVTWLVFIGGIEVWG